MKNKKQVQKYMVSKLSNINKEQYTEIDNAKNIKIKLFYNENGTPQIITKLNNTFTI